MLYTIENWIVWLSDKVCTVISSMFIKGKSSITLASICSLISSIDWFSISKRERLKSAPKSGLKTLSLLLVSK